MSKTRAFVLALVLGCAARTSVLAAGAPSGSGAGPEIPVEPNPPTDRGTGNAGLGARGEPGGVFVSGIVRDSAGQPIPSVSVRLFGSGALVAQASTDGEGAFEISGDPQFGPQRTVDLWFVSTDPARWVDVQIILSASRLDRIRGLLSPCTPVVNLLGNAATVDVTMWTPEEKRAEIAKSHCLEAAAGD